MNLPQQPSINLAERFATRTYHEPVLRPSSAVNFGSTTPIQFGVLLLTAFTLNTDGAWQQFRIPTSYVDSAAFHVHWSKTTDANNLNRFVRWRISYTVFNGIDQVGNGTATVLETENAYLDSGTTTRVVYRSPNLDASGFIAGYYVAVMVQAVTPVGAALTGEPGLFALDLTYREYINQ
jgi:hypothetical protein